MSYSGLFLYMITTAITPGPNNLVSMYLGLNTGFREYLRFFAGSMTGLFTKTFLCGILNVLLAEKIPTLVPYLKWFGALYMLCLAFLMIKSGFNKHDNVDSFTKSASFSSGILLQCMNVKSWIAAVSMYAAYVIPHTSSTSAVALTAVAYLFCIAFSSILWCCFGRTLKKQHARHRILISSLMGLSLVYCAYTVLI